MRSEQNVTKIKGTQFSISVPNLYDWFLSTLFFLLLYIVYVVFSRVISSILIYFLSFFICFCACQNVTLYIYCLTRTPMVNFDTWHSEIRFTSIWKNGKQLNITKCNNLLTYLLVTKKGNAKSWMIKDAGSCIWP